MSARVVQATAWYGPHHVGGTEIYVEGLAEALAARGIESTILTPRVPGGPDAYLHAGRRVETYPVADATRSETRAGTPPGGFETFRHLLGAYRGAIYHQHAWTRGCGLAHLEAARALGLRTVFTIHVPAVTCLRGSMLRFGVEPCAGEVEARACGACWANGRGVPRRLAGPLAHLPLAATRRIRQLPSRLATAMAARTIGAERQDQLRAMIAASDRIVAVCHWLADALRINGVPAEKLVLSRQGLRDGFAATASAPRPRATEHLALLYLGRYDPIKGIDILVQAVRRARSDMLLTICGIVQSDEDRAFAARLRAMAGGDPRIRFSAPVPRDELAAELGRHDVLAAPSRIMETGPLVVLEARAAGLFVLGSRLGGIAELVREDSDGMLVAPDDVAAWTQAIEHLAARHVRRGAPAPVRTTRDVADDMSDLYDSL